MSKRYIPIAMQETLDEIVSATCFLLLFSLTNGEQFGITNLNEAITYRGITYSAANGFDYNIFATDVGLSVDNTEVNAFLKSTDIPGLTLDMVRRGDLDDASWSLYLVDFHDLSRGHVLVGSGDVGEVRIVDDTVYMPELLDIGMRLKQSIGTTWSVLCRATFGTPANTQKGCGFDASAMWTEHTVNYVGTDSRIEFGDTVTLVPTFPFPGRVQFLTGNNASSRLYQVESYDEDNGILTVLEPTMFPIEIGDTYQVRKDCLKTAEACRAYSNFINYKGENLIPVGDGAMATTPGASTAT